MDRSEAIMIMKEFLEDCNKTQKNEYKTPLRKAFDMSYEALCKNDKGIYFTQKEIDTIMQSIISSVVDISNELQDKVLALLNENALPY